MATVRGFTPRNIYLSKHIKSLKGITFACLNVCSVVRKLVDIHTILSNSDLCFLGLTESWLNSSISDCELEIPGYEIFRFDRDLGLGRRGGGGILVYCKSNRTFVQIPEWSLCSMDLEWMWCKMLLPSTRPTFICIFYRPPSGSVDCFLDLLEQKIIDIYTLGVADILIMGDANINLADFRNANCKKYLNAMNILHLNQIVKDPTRITATSRTLIDHVIVNRSEI